MPRPILVILAVFAFASQAAAEPLYLSGTIAKVPVLFMLQRDGATELSGWYMYLRHGREIRVTGNIDAGGHFDLTAPSDRPEFSEHITGNVHGGKWTGDWNRAPASAALPVVLTENRDTLAGISGHFACNPSQRDSAAGYTFSESLDFTLTQGRATKFSASHSAKGDDGDEQFCGIALKDLERTASHTGIRFRAKGDEPGTDGGHCSVHLIAAGDYLYLAMGDFTEDGNDCRASGDEMYCSPRANWNDIIVNRKTGACSMVQ